MCDEAKGGCLKTAKNRLRQGIFVEYVQYNLGEAITPRRKNGGFPLREGNPTIVWSLTKHTAGCKNLPPYHATII